jgi:hypothetical protein
MESRTREAAERVFAAPREQDRQYDLRTRHGGVAAASRRGGVGATLTLLAPVNRTQMGARGPPPARPSSLPSRGRASGDGAALAGGWQSDLEALYSAHAGQRPGVHPAEVPQHAACLGGAYVSPRHCRTVAPHRARRGGGVALHPTYHLELVHRPGERGRVGAGREEDDFTRGGVRAPQNAEGRVTERGAVGKRHGHGHAGRSALLGGRGVRRGADQGEQEQYVSKRRLGFWRCGSRYQRRERARRRAGAIRPARRQTGGTCCGRRHSAG